jgi:membrane-associated protein
MHLFNIPLIIETVGVMGISLIIFAESGLFFGFFFPGDSLLFTAGLLASGGYGNIYLYLIFCFIAAVLGDNVGYFTGRKMGPLLFKKEDSFIFKKKYLNQTEEFFKKYGKKALIFARFIPIVRTFAPILAGAGKMNYKKFFIFNVIGGFLWTWLMLLAGYFLGTYIPSSEKYLSLIIIFIIIISFIAPAVEIIKSRHKGL